MKVRLASLRWWRQGFPYNVWISEGSSNIIIQHAGFTGEPVGPSGPHVENYRSYESKHAESSKYLRLLEVSNTNGSQPVTEQDLDDENRERIRGRKVNLSPTLTPSLTVTQFDLNMSS